MGRYEDICIQHIKLAREAAECLSKATFAKTAEEADMFKVKYNELKLEIEKLRAERKSLEK